MSTTDTDLQQLIINVGTTAQIEAAISGGTITSDMLSITTDGADYADVNLSNLTSTGKETSVNLVMPGYYSKARVNLTSDVWYLATKDILLTAIVEPGIVGGIYASNDGGTTVAFLMPCTAPAGGLSTCSTYIRKGLYYKVISNNAAYYDELMGE